MAGADGRVEPRIRHVLASNGQWTELTLAHITENQSLYVRKGQARINNDLITFYDNPF